MGSRDARDELARPHEETYMHAVYADSAEYSFIPDSLPAVKPTVGGASLAAGHYSGFVVTYDWSGKYILGEQPLAQEFGGIPGGDEAQDEDNGRDGQRVEQFEPHGVGIGDEHALGAAQLQQPVLLLQVTEYYPQNEARTGPDSRDEPPLGQEYARDESVVGSQFLQGVDVAFLVDDEHREGAYYVEGGNHQDKREDEEGNPLLNLYPLVPVVLLDVGRHAVRVAQSLFQLLGHGMLGVVGSEAQLDGRHVARLSEQVAGKVQRGQQVV